ncbi:bifunctional folylpolyglutamate synthase/dihydrofolate synthase [Telmatobacter bradus]|uniref:bifunctional folylpolyglutamate synthase/dihydrofolate synthase n=1 Tax=Telmatobacter bradus TaxID=474953 RepID=UPI003B429FEF
MSYADATAQLFSMMPELSVLPGQPRRKFSLSEVRSLLEALGSPEKNFPAVLIAGTNGKGSTASSLASILHTAGYRTGLYTSPHLTRVNERIRIGNIDIADEDFAHHFFRVKEAADRLVVAGTLPQPPSFFEVITALAFSFFSEQKVEIAVLEVGMGGRLDATNVVEPILSVITDISLDHTEWLGPDLYSIAREKAGILRPAKPAITLPQQPEVDRGIGEICQAVRAVAVSALPFLPPQKAEDSYPLQMMGEGISVHSPLHGEHQHRNLALALAAVDQMGALGFSRLNARVIEEGIAATRWPGRLEKIERNGQRWILDVAHNPAGAEALRSGLRATMRDNLLPVLVFSCLRDKPLTELAQILFPLFRKIVLAPIHSQRATSLDVLRETAKAFGEDAVVSTSVEEALQCARQIAGAEEVVVSGSVYLVGEVRSILLAGEVYRQ